jgi:integrase/recombinase XerD
LNAKTDRRHERRAIEADGLRKLLVATAASKVDFAGLTGPDRRILYHVAMTTGFRSSELASLTPAAFDLDAATPTVVVRAAYSKSRRQTFQPLPSDVAEALRGYLQGKPPHAPLWAGDWQELGAEMLRGDLEAAGIPYRDPAGKVADLHALRHSYITLLKEAGVSPKNAQELARHSDIRLTMDVYTHTRASDLADDVRKLPRLG